MAYWNPKIDALHGPGIVELLQGLPRQATSTLVTGTRAIPSWDGIERHYQGIAPYNDTTDASSGFISASSTEGYFSGFAGSPPVVQSVVTPDRRYFHVAAMQMLGDLLAVPCESDDRSLNAFVAFYDVTHVGSPSLMYTQSMPGRKASAAAITAYVDYDGIEQVMLMVYEYDHHEMYIYQALFSELGNRNSPFVHKATISSQQLNTGDQYQSFALVTQLEHDGEKVYLLGFREDEELWLSLVDTTNTTAWGQLARIKRYQGWSGSDWRNGMGLQIVSDSQVRLFGTAKDPSGTSTNYSFNIYVYGT